ncbi:hypothetical protein B0T17DRAFT_489074 [Bombardia bombarda]|uniref:Acetylserotonin methytransferase-like protein n=1 Tax=Bombardia bombarda TaxID=252184 RepID=A0AA40C972_9PEZI|nr:hypothetical protein B0T17DRAFT_489074 [Bombardia bombarda]
MSAPPPAGGFSLFPNTSNTPRPPSRNQPTRPRAATPQGRPSISTEPGPSQVTPPRVGRQASVRRAESVREGKQREISNNPWQSALDARHYQQQQQEQQQQYQQQQEQHYLQQQQQQQQQYPPPPPQQPQIDTTVANHYPLAEAFSPIAATDVPPRCETALSEARTLVRSPSVRSRSSIAKPPIAYVPAGPSPPHAEPGLRSIFPQYNPEVPLDRQEYYPTQASPVHIPQSAISRPMYSPRTVGPRSPPLRSPLVSPAPTASGRWPGGRVQEPSVIPPVSTTEELRGLWKVANGWKASPLEGRTFCLKMTGERDAPVYTLSSASSQPFYSLRVDPTSASALVSLSRYDPNKPFKSNTASSSSSASLNSPNGNGSSGNSPSPRASSSSKFELKNEKHDAKHWQEVLSTGLEEASRRQPPNDGLVAQLWPAAAMRLALDRANDATTVMLAEHECARLVWDADSGNHFLVHPALAMPFCVTIERNAAFSRTEYTLEHVESPLHLGRLTRDGTGAGWLEVDTAIASKIDAVYLIDVVVAALVLVAHADEQFTFVETFEPPPVVVPGGSLSSKRSSRGSRRGSRREEKKERQREMMGNGPAKKQQQQQPPAKSRMEQFEMDIESQVSELGKLDAKGDKEKLPGTARGIIALLTVTFKCVIWCVTILFKALMAVIAGLAKCLGSDKL